MKAAIAKILAAAALSAGAGAAHPAQAAIYTYVGSFTTNGLDVEFAGGGSVMGADAAPYWATDPPVYSGIQAAALLFGGSPGEYVTSTSPGTINDLAWYDGWGDHVGHQWPDTYSLDKTGLGYNGCAIAQTNCFYSAYSAYVSDGFSATNYVYQVSQVPLPGSFALLGTALAAMGGIGGNRARRKAA